MGTVNAVTDHVPLRMFRGTRFAAVLVQPRPAGCFATLRREKVRLDATRKEAI